MAAQRTPTERQYKYLRPIAGGAAWIVASKRDCEPLIRHGWVTAEQKQDDRGFYYAFARITPDGLRALALAVEKYGLPDLPNWRPQEVLDLEGAA